MTEFQIAVVDGTYRVYVTTTGIDRTYIPSAAFGKPRDAIRYADMRALEVSPLRTPDEAPVAPLAGASSGALTGTSE